MFGWWKMYGCSCKKNAMTFVEVMSKILFYGENRQSIVCIVQSQNWNVNEIDRIDVIIIRYYCKCYEMTQFTKLSVF